MKKMVLAAMLLALLSACQTENTYCPNTQETIDTLEEINNILIDFGEEAGSNEDMTPDEVEGPLARLGEFKRQAFELVVPGCLEAPKDYLIKAINAYMTGLEKFGNDPYDASVEDDMNASLEYINQVNNEYLKFNDCFPDCFPE